MTKNDKQKILIVDDDKFLLDMYSLKFSENGFDVNVAFSGEEALTKLDQGFTPDVFLVDIIMPVMDGFQFIEQIKQRGADKSAAVVILSNLGQKEDIDKALSLQVDGYIVKASATPSEVVTKVIDISNNKKTK